ncbi:MAG: Gfo/Idh/MocA family oxidoreductase [Tepidisphaeraceae bacterium]
MGDAVSLALVGIGGYGNSYVSALLDAPNQDDFRIVGVVDPSPASCRRLGELEARRVPVYASMEKLYAEHTPQLVILSTPHQLHATQTCDALTRGSHVLCEKPLCVTPKQIEQMKQARDATRKAGAGKLVAIGYQWSFSETVQALKADILSGRFGKPKRLRCMALWPRDEVYYARNRWAGAKTDAAGRLVLDSPVNNACAHYLHNLLYLIGDAIDRSAQPATLTAELYRAHRIENYDTAALRGVTRDGVEVLFIVSHATQSRLGPVFSCEFERGVVTFADKPGATIKATFADGTTHDYGSPNDDRERKLWLTLDAVRNAAPTLCGIEAAEPHTRCTWAAQQSEIVTFAPSLIRVEGPAGLRKTWIEGLGQTLEQCYEQGKLPSELSVPWARPGRGVPVA